MLLMVITFAGGISSLKIAIDGLILCFSALDHGLDPGFCDNNLTVGVHSHLFHVLSNGQLKDTCFATLKLLYSLKAAKITEGERHALAASWKDLNVLESLDHDRRNWDPHLARLLQQIQSFGIEAMIQDSWLAEPRVPLDRLYTLSSAQDLSPSSCMSDITSMFMLDEIDVPSPPSRGTPDCIGNATVKWDSFQKRVHGLPPELFRMIKDMMFDEAFGPKPVFPCKDHAVMNLFLALDRQLYRKYSDIYWCQNTWVIEQGSVNKTMRFMTQRPYDARVTQYSLQTPNRSALTIKFLHIYLSKKDVPHSIEWLEDTASCENLPLGFEDRLIIQRFRKECEYFKSTAFRIWQDKFDRIAVLNLRHLRLDLMEAFAPDGEYVGVSAVERFIPFAHGLPPDFKIHAPTPYKQEIQNVFDAMNTH